MFIAYKYRIYPTPKQEVLINKTFGCCRFVYNRALEFKTSLYKKEKKGISVFGLIMEMVSWKDQEETKWLKEVNSQALQISLRNLDGAYTRFFRDKKAFPKFKSKYSKQSFTNTQHTKIDLEKSLVYITKFKEGIKCIFHQRFNGKVKSSTVSRTPSGKYFISILVETIDERLKPQKAQENKTLGIDLGIKNYATFSDGTIIPNPKHLNKKIKQLKRQQRKLNRKKKGSKNREKQKIKVARIHEKIKNSRKDFLHKVTSNLVKNQDYTSIAIEDLDVSGMLKNGKKTKISKHIADAGWRMFRQFLTYKCERNGKNLLVIGRFEPSSKLCTCGFLNKNLTLKDREWDCPSCESHHNRDELAAKNIKRFAFCTQNTHKISVPQELREFMPREACVSGSMKEEIFEMI